MFRQLGTAVWRSRPWARVRPRLGGFNHVRVGLHRIRTMLRPVWGGLVSGSTKLGGGLRSQSAEGGVARGTVAEPRCNPLLDSARSGPLRCALLAASERRQGGAGEPSLQALRPPPPRCVARASPCYRSDLQADAQAPRICRNRPHRASALAPIFVQIRARNNLLLGSWTTPSPALIRTRIRAVSEARRDGVDAWGPVFLRPLWGVVKCGSNTAMERVGKRASKRGELGSRRPPLAHLHCVCSRLSS